MEDLSHLVSFVGHINALHVLEKLNEFAWMQSVDIRPVWYTEDLHGQAFDFENEYSLVEYDHGEGSRIFHTLTFQRGLAADRLLQELENIPASRKGADCFHNWVVRALATIFFEDLERVRKNPNPNAAEQRDIVATNTQRNRFWQRLYVEYKVSMPVFEAKNYTPPDAEDFRQVYSYLGHQHHGILGFIVTRAEDLTLPSSTLRQFREMYRKDGLGKLIIVIPSALLVELLDDIQYGRANKADGKMAAWLEEFLLNHLNE